MTAVAASAPLFSIIIPTYARPEQLKACLEGLAALDVPRDRFEVIVSDDGSPMPVEPVVASFHDRLRIALVAHPNTGLPGARNRGAARAQGTYLAFIDDDCIPAPDWLTALASRFARAPDHLIGGRILNALPENPFSTATQLIVTYAADYYDRRGEGDRLFNGSNIAMPADRFRELGGFSDAFRLGAGEDYDLCHRWQHAGYHVTYAPDVIVHHAHALTFSGFCRQHFNYGRGLFRFRLRSAQRTRQRIKGEAPAFYINLLLFPLKQERGMRGWLHALLLVVSQVATAAGMIREALAGGARQCTSERPAIDRGSV